MYEIVACYFTPVFVFVYSFFFFFSSRRRHTRYWRDWSSDVCSSDLHGRLGAARGAWAVVAAAALAGRGAERARPAGGNRAPRAGLRGRAQEHVLRRPRDRKSVVQGKSVDLGGRRIIKKKNKKINDHA